MAIIAEGSITGSTSQLDGFSGFASVKLSSQASPAASACAFADESILVIFSSRFVR
jgi:hypothetical protein